MIQAFARYVDSLSGRYITAEDVGTTTADMDLIHSITPHVTGISESLGGSGNPSPVTAYGVFMGLKAASKFKFGTDDLNGKRSEEHTSELQSRPHLVCRLLLEK